MGRYEARVLLKGTTERDRRIARIQDDISTKIVCNPSYKPNAIITDSYGNERHVGLVINSGTQEYYKEFEALPKAEIYAGDYVRWGRGIWVCKVYMPVDEEVLAVTKKKEMLFIIDNATLGQPRIYEAHNPSNVYSTFDVLRSDDGKLHGVTDWILKETTYTLSQEEKELGVCKHRKLTEETQPDTSDISGSSTLPLTKSKTYSVNMPQWDNNYHWKVTCAYPVIQEADGQSIKVRVDDRNAIGSFLKIEVIDYGTVVATKSVEIKGIYG